MGTTEGVGMAIALAKWSLEDYHQMIAANILAGRSVELLQGAIVEMAPEGPDHAQTSTDAADYLRRTLADRALVREAKSITLPESASEPEPDIAIVHPLRSLYRSRHPYPGEIFWLMEYANTSWLKDAEVKRALYAQAGIREYWIVNLKRREMLVLRQPEGGNYSVEINLRQGRVTPLAFPGLDLSVERLIEGLP